MKINNHEIETHHQNRTPLVKFMFFHFLFSLYCSRFVLIVLFTYLVVAIPDLVIDSWIFRFVPLLCFSCIIWIWVILYWSFMHYLNMGHICLFMYYVNLNHHVFLLLLICFYILVKRKKFFFYKRVSLYL